LPVLDASRTNLFTSTTAEAAINMTLKRYRVAGEPSFTDCAHQVKTSAWPIILITGDYVGRTSFETQAAMDTGEKLLLLGG
jgi:hypothetical protein